MGILNFLTGGVRLAESQATAANLVTPFSSQDHLEQALAADFWGEAPAEVITPEIALRVPEVHRALQAHISLVAPIHFVKFTGGSQDTTQPFWVSNSDYPAMSPYLRWKGTVKDLFLFGFALLGAEVDGSTDLPRDMIHIPRDLWTISTEGSIDVDERIPTKYRQRLILIPLGDDGILAHGIDSIRQARKLELARQARLDSPPVGTELHITDSNFDEMTKDERRKLRKNFVEDRQANSVAITPSFIELKERGTSGQLDLFETGMNSLRLQLAMHGGVPADFLEAGKEGGSGGQIRYQNVNGETSDLWTFGSAQFAYAITARLSMDDVVGEGSEVRGDMSAFAVPAPTSLDSEAGDPTQEVTPNG